MFNVIKNLKDSITLILVLVLIGLVVISMTTCSHYRDAVADLEAIAKQQIEQNKVLKLQYQAEALLKELAWKEKERQAYEKFTQDLQTISAYYTGNKQLLDRLQYNTTETIKYLSTMEPQAREDYVKAQSDGAIEGTALLVEADRIAREYDAEIERIIKSCSSGEDPPQDQE